MDQPEDSQGALRPDIWATLERSVAPKRNEGAPGIRPGASGSASTSLRANRLLDAAGILLWLYFLLKLFVLDVDRVVLRAIDPRLESLVDYRFLVYLAIVAIIVGLGRRHW